MADLLEGHWFLWDLLPEMSLQVATHQRLGLDEPCRRKHKSLEVQQVGQQDTNGLARGC